MQRFCSDSCRELSWSCSEKETVSCRNSFQRSYCWWLWILVFIVRERGGVKITVEQRVLSSRNGQCSFWLVQWPIVLHVSVKQPHVHCRLLNPMILRTKIFYIRVTRDMNPCPWLLSMSSHTLDLISKWTVITYSSVSTQTIIMVVDHGPSLGRLWELQ